MRERRYMSFGNPGWGWFATSLVLSLVGALLIVSGVLGAALSGLSGEHPKSTPFLAAAGCGVAAILLAAVGWLGAKDRGAVRAGLVIAGLIGGLVVAVGARGAYENRARPLAACRNWDSPAPATSARGENVLNGVAAISPSNAWAVGWCGLRTMILHWDGTTWELQPSPNVSTHYNYLNGVAATSPSDAWAVGEGVPEGGWYRTLILHWDGTAWKREPSPNEGEGDNHLRGVAATSASDAWAVGSWINGPVILHWDGKAWTRQPSPEVGPGIYPHLTGVAATSPSNAWAVGEYGGFGAPFRTVIFHWDGTAWELQSSPNVGTGHSGLNGVAATSPSNAWAVGWYADGTERRTLILHWNGKAWKLQPSPNVGTDNVLNGVAATSTSNAWAVGQGQGKLILCWNGTAWEPQSSPNVGTGNNVLNGVAASSPSNAWAVGLNGDGTAGRVSLTHC